MTQPTDEAEDPELAQVVEQLDRMEATLDEIAEGPDRQGRTLSRSQPRTYMRSSTPTPVSATITVIIRA